MTNWNDDSAPRPAKAPSAAARSRGKLGGLTTSSKYDMNAMAANARRGLDRKFEDEVDPERKLPEEERARRADAARKLYYHRLALSGAAARRAKGGAKK